MCDQCNDDFDAVVESLHERHDDANDRLDALKGLYTRLRDAIAQAREDADQDEADPETEDDELFDEDEEEDE